MERDRSPLSRQRYLGGEYPKAQQELFDGEPYGPDSLEKWKTFIREGYGNIDAETFPVDITVPDIPVNGPTEITPTHLS